MLVSMRCLFYGFQADARMIRGWNDTRMGLSSHWRRVTKYLITSHHSLLHCLKVHIRTSTFSGTSQNLETSARLSQSIVGLARPWVWTMSLNHRSEPWVWTIGRNHRLKSWVSTTRVFAMGIGYVTGSVGMDGPWVWTKGLNHGSELWVWTPGLNNGWGSWVLTRGIVHGYGTMSRPWVWIHGLDHGYGPWIRTMDMEPWL